MVTENIVNPVTMYHTRSCKNSESLSLGVTNLVGAHEKVYKSEYCVSNWIQVLKDLKFLHRAHAQAYTIFLVSSSGCTWTVERFSATSSSLNPLFSLKEFRSFILLDQVVYRLKAERVERRWGLNKYRLRWRHFQFEVTSSKYYFFWFNLRSCSIPDFQQTLLFVQDELNSLKRTRTASQN